jgi:hypothetical protein
MADFDNTAEPKTLFSSLYTGQEGLGQAGTICELFLSQSQFFSRFQNTLSYFRSLQIVFFGILSPPISSLVILYLIINIFE